MAPRPLYYGIERTDPGTESGKLAAPSGDVICCVCTESPVGAHSSFSDIDCAGRCATFGRSLPSRNTNDHLGRRSHRSRRCCSYLKHDVIDMCQSVCLVIIIQYPVLLTFKPYKDKIGSCEKCAHLDRGTHHVYDG